MATVSLETRSSYGELVRGVGVQFVEAFNQSQNSYSLAMDDMLGSPGNKRTALAKQVSTNASKAHFIQKTGLNYLSLTEEGDAFAADSRLLGYKTSVTPQKFTTSVSVTQEAMEDRDYDSQLSEYADLGITGKETMDKAFFDMFNYAFTAQSSLPDWLFGYGDGKPLASTSHPRVDGGTAQRNTFASGTTQLTLTDTNLETARIDLMRQLDDRGKPIRGGGRPILLVPIELEKTAAILTRGEKRSGTANNDINIYDGTMTVISSKWLAYSGNGGSLPSTAWFLIDPVLAKLLFVLREGLGTHSWTDPNTLSQSFYIRTRFACAWTDFRGVYGSLGDLSAYSS